MVITKSIGRDRHLAFTLIELLIVIAIIGILAALIIPVTGAVKKAGIMKRTKTELAQLETAIENYKSTTGFYPPDNPDNPALNQLYFELAGTRLDTTNRAFITLDGNATVKQADLPVVFGPKVTGLLNSSKGGGGDDSPVLAKRYLQGYKAAQTADLTLGAKVLVGPVAWPADKVPAPTSIVGLNPWRYNSSSPTNKAGAYDLWIDFYIGSKLYRIGNWTEQALQP
jgi:prepilin-type N-terminal cleavage/methylation domain-containing protein